jgi:hypothetical protein
MNFKKNLLDLESLSLFRSRSSLDMFYPTWLSSSRTKKTRRNIAGNMIRVNVAAAAWKQLGAVSTNQKEFKLFMPQAQVL